MSLIYAEICLCSKIILRLAKKWDCHFSNFACHTDSTPGICAILYKDFSPNKRFSTFAQSAFKYGQKFLHIHFTVFLLLWAYSTKHQHYLSPYNGYAIGRRADVL